MSDRMKSLKDLNRCPKCKSANIAGPYPEEARFPTAYECFSCSHKFDQPVTLADDPASQPLKCLCGIDVSEYCPFHGHIQFAANIHYANPCEREDCRAMRAALASQTPTPPPPAERMSRLTKAEFTFDARSLETLPVNELRCNGPYGNEEECSVHGAEIRAARRRSVAGPGDAARAEHIYNELSDAAKLCTPKEDFVAVLVSHFVAARRELGPTSETGSIPAGAAREGRNWKGVLWRDSIKMRNLAEEIGLHFAHDCNDSLCGEDADASNCEVAWIEDKLIDFLDEQALAANASTPTLTPPTFETPEVQEQFQASENVCKHGQAWGLCPKCNDLEEL
jgi:hypothetical protein